MISGIPVVRLFLVEEATQLLCCRIAVGLPIEDQQDLTVPIGRSFSGRVAATRRPMAVADTRADPRLQHPAHAERHRLVSYLGLPVVHQDRLFGVLAFSAREPREYTEGKMALLMAFAQLAAAALHHAQIHEAARSELLERRQAEAALRQREEQYRSLAENLPDAIARFDSACRRIYANRHWEAGAAVAGGATRPGRASPEGRADPWADALRAAIRDGQIHTVEYAMRAPHGREEYEVRVVPERGPDGAVDTFLVIHRNITARKRSEQILAERTRQLEAVRAIGVEIARELDLKDLLGLIARRAVELVQSPAGAVILWDEAAQSLVPRAWHGCGEWILATRSRLGEGLAGTVAAERRGGHVGVASVLGQGSIFTLRFQMAERREAGAHAGTTPAAAASRRILLVDDEPNVRKTVAAMLRTAGHTVVEAEGPRSGLNRLAEGSVDLAITDLGMPDLNGIELARRIKALSPALPVVLLTGWGDCALDPEPLRGAVDAVLGKPIGLRELLECVERCCRSVEAGPTD